MPDPCDMPVAEEDAAAIAIKVCSQVRQELEGRAGRTCLYAVFLDTERTPLELSEFAWATHEERLTAHPDVVGVLVPGSWRNWLDTESFLWGEEIPEA
tara:strand:- start:122 stop:415 length:294 start_codon:yes stop_codon:yes gene_type:complete